jgi:hypothetical protein
VSDDERIAIAFSKDEWGIIQEALDTYYYEVEHSDPGGFRRRTRERLTERRLELLKTLPELDVAISQQAGVGPLFGDG